MIDEALPLWDVIWSREIEGIDFSHAGPAGRPREAAWRTVRPDRGQAPEALVRAEGENPSFRSVLALSAGQAQPFRPGARDRATDTALIRSTELLAGIPTRQVGLERIFLGLCVECPDLAVDHYERIIKVTMRGVYSEAGDTVTHQRFVDALMDLLTSEQVDGPAEIYRRLDPAFSGALDFFHGRGTPEFAMGHRLRSRFRIMGVHPPREFVERCFFNFLQIFLVREMEDDLASLLEQIEKSPSELDSRTEEHLLRLQRELIQTREAVNATELELAEEASLYRYPSGAASGGFKIAA